MKTVLFMAMSANGIIARENGDEDFLPHYGWDLFVRLAREHGNFIIGRKTYEITKQNYQGFGFDDLADLKGIIVSGGQTQFAPERYTIAPSPEAAVNILREENFGTALLTGGSVLNSSFAKKRLIDEMIVNVEPVVVGRGMPIFSPDDFDLKLTLLSFDRHEEGGLTLHYRVER